MTVARAAILTALLLGGCAGHGEFGERAALVDWRHMATPADREHLRGWRDAWDGALAKARAAAPQAIAADPVLFDPDHALRDPSIPPGRYRCRTYKLGGVGTATRDFTAYPWFECNVADEGEVVSIDKRTGSQRPTGLLFRDPDSPRLVFLGTLMLGDETAPLRYGTDATRDMVGYLDRVEVKRWRWVFPSPRFESMLDVTELVPAD